MLYVNRNAVKRMILVNNYEPNRNIGCKLFENWDLNSLTAVSQVPTVCLAHSRYLNSF